MALEGVSWLRSELGSFGGFWQLFHHSGQAGFEGRAELKTLPTEFDDQPVRRVFDEDTETWWFSVVDVVQVLTQQVVQAVVLSLLIDKVRLGAKAPSALA